MKNRILDQLNSSEISLNFPLCAFIEYACTLATDHRIVAGAFQGD